MQQETRFAAYRRLRNRRTLATWATMAVLLVLLAMGVQDWPLLYRSAVAVGIGGAYLGFIWLDWRCPECGKRLGRPSPVMQCPHCGAALTPEAAAAQGGGRA
ncbi:rubredoxin [Symbiobacterium terraclitae]|uniref:Rubredoxin n=1 Tax=Symbiobacterium terraclitae TaxID=557451 RepID=A0ABS4JPB0_9FIRM|nr:hypothetical protein [Symbiobacterium terraclitae]MBP2017350.1 rubredoxin [Symbiobacterium terraclitae]